MKKIISILGILAFTAGIAFAQSNVADISTTGDLNTTTILQTGTNNDGVISQVANSSSATQTQTGASNEASIMQYGLWPAGPVVNQVAAQTQIGNNNEAQIRQITDSGNGNSLATQLQDGSGHYTKAWQFSWSGKIQQEQFGQNNWAEAFQKGYNNTIIQIQDGTANVAAVDEQDGWGSVHGNLAEQYQYGNWNHSLIGQYGGDGNKAKVTQDGNDNWAGFGLSGGGLWGIYQAGNGNEVIVEQNLNVNKSAAFQYGDANLISVTQNGGTGLFNTYGDYVNKSEVTQNGNGNAADVVQTFVP